MRRRRRFLAVLVALGAAVPAAPACDAGGTSAPPAGGGGGVTDPKVVVLVIDGARASETFDNSTHAHVPLMWNALRPQGTIVTRFRNEGRTLTVPGHASIATGTWQDLPNDGSKRPTAPTFFEYLRAATGAPASDAAVVSGKSKLRVCTYGTHADYGEAYGATEDVGLPGDRAVVDELVTVLATQRPRLVLACLPGVDWAGHGGVWSEYLAAIERADSMVWRTWNAIQADSFYAGQTYLFVTNDHGRHDDAHGGFRNHGDACEGCRRLMFLALGPGVPRGAVVDSTYTQVDLCATIGRVMGFETPLAAGRVMEAVVGAPPAGVRPPAGGGR